MAWTTPQTWTVNQVVTASDMNTDIRDNMNVGAVALVTTAGDVVQGTGSNAIERLAIGDAGEVLTVNAGATRIEYAEVAVGGTMPQVWSTVSGEGVGSFLAGTGATWSGVNVWPVANKAVYIPFVCNEAVTVTQLFNINGNVVSGNIDVGIYTAAGSKVITSGSTTQSGTDVVQVYNIADTALAVGRYYFALALDNTSGRNNGMAALNVHRTNAMGCLQQTSAFPLPSSATFAAYSEVFVPVVGAMLGTVM